MMMLALAITAIVLLSALSIGLAIPANEVLRKARESRATWDEQFPGFDADLVVWVDDAKVEGKVRVAADGEVTFDVPESDARTWAIEQLRSEVVHLKPGPSPFGSEAEYAEAKGKAEHPLGPLITISDDRFSSSYRIRDDRIREVNRTMGDVRFSIKTLMTRENAEGKQLPRVYTVSYWNASTGALSKVETIEVVFARVGSYDLPASRTMVLAKEGGASVRRMELTGHLLGGA